MAVSSQRRKTTKKSTKQMFPVRGSSLGLEVDNLDQVVRRIKGGFSYDALSRFQRTSQLPWERIAGVIQIPHRTLVRRKAAGKLTSDESERLLRLSLLYEKAVSLFEGDADAARQWLQKPNRALGDKSPLTLVETEIGAREVEDLIGRLEHGVFT